MAKTRWWVYAVPAIVGVLALPARADVAFEAIPPTPTSSVVAPAIKIAKPGPLEVLHARDTQAPDGEIGADWAELGCLLDRKDRAVTLSVDGGALPAGVGITIVADGEFATHVTDLKAPILFAAMDPYKPSAKYTERQGPMSRCGWHWIAAFPTDATGRALAHAPVAFNWFYTQSAKDTPRSFDQIKDLQSRPVVVVNWPLLGTYDPGAKWGGDQDSTGFVVRDRDRIHFDYLVAQTSEPSCETTISLDGSPGGSPQHPDVVKGRGGLIDLRHVPTDQSLWTNVTCNGQDGIDSLPVWGWISFRIRDKGQASRAAAWIESTGNNEFHAMSYWERHPGSLNQELQRLCDEGRTEHCSHH